MSTIRGYFDLLIFLVILTAATSQDTSSASCVNIQNEMGDDTVTCANFKDSKTLSEHAKAVQNKTSYYLVLENITMEYLPIDAFNEFLFDGIYLQNCNLKSLGDANMKTIVDQSEKSLMDVTLNSSVVENFDWAVFSKFKGLKNIEIMSTSMGKIAGWNSLAQMSIRLFAMNDAKLHKIGEKMFGNHEELDLIDFSRNFIVNITRDLFPKPADKLEIISFAYNKIAFLPSDIFEDMPALQELEFDNNQLKVIPENIFSPIWNRLNMTSILLEGNPVNCDNQILWIVKKINENKNDTDVASPDIICVSPPKMKGKMISELKESDL